MLKSPPRLYKFLPLVIILPTMYYTYSRLSPANGDHLDLHQNYTQRSLFRSNTNLAGQLKDKRHSRNVGRFLKKSYQSKLKTQSVDSKVSNNTKTQQNPGGNKADLFTSKYYNYTLTDELKAWFKDITFPSTLDSDFLIRYKRFKL